MTRKRSHSEVSSGSSTTSEDEDSTTSENPTAAFFVDLVGTDMVDIHVGRDDEKKLFRDHKKRICAHSSYFKVVSRKAKGSQDSQMNLRSSSICSSKLLALHFAMDSIMTSIRSRHYKKNFYFEAGSIEEIYTNTFRNTQLRAYAIELFVYTLGGDTDEDEKMITN
ncbi:hypothetical protein BCON_0088g00310 [Botryotinia convoluta]|uniref:BTB domain-containing protein n=1 Tax=Botryotinia convoluta TaxID=54673 RepID=A0A4Z1I9Z8_9HELO|nr:hypothetical protein BCON_0088g00310 [Botryotinia convoluta]